MNEQHKNSRKVTIFRTSSFHLDAQKEKAPEYESQSIKYIGPYMIHQSRAIGSGMLKKEMDLLLPQLLSITPNDQKYNEEIRRFYNDLHTSVPYLVGRTYETGLETSNEDPMSESNMPIDVMDYIRYRHAVGGPGSPGSPNVAKSKDDITSSNPLIWFFVYDPLNEQKAQHALGDARDQASEIYHSLKKDKDKVDMYLTMLNKDPRSFAALADKQIALRKVADDNPAEFLRVHKTDNFELRYKIQTLINLEIFKVVNGTQIVDKETNKLIGNNMNDAIAELQRPELETNMILWLQKMQEGLKKTFKRRP